MKNYSANIYDSRKYTIKTTLMSLTLNQTTLRESWVLPIKQHQVRKGESSKVQKNGSGESHQITTHPVSKICLQTNS